jgi:hypothetical protein
MSTDKTPFHSVRRADSLTKARIQKPHQPLKSAKRIILNREIMIRATINAKRSMKRK